MFRMRRSRGVDVFDVDYETSMKLILFLTFDIRSAWPMV